MQAKYTDGTPVKSGDRVRYKQQPGGILAPGDWREGIAQPLPMTPEYRATRTRKWGWDPDELHLFDGQYHYHVAGHIIERL